MEEKKGRCSEDDFSGSVRQYAALVFHESLVTGVPNIVQVPSWKWKIFKLGVLGFCLGGFLYQATTFVCYVLTYPSVVDIQVKTPKEFLYPAFTMCNNNGIRRSKFCEAYPDRCETPENRTQFCSHYPHYCHNLTDWESFKVPKHQFLHFEKNVTLKELKHLGHQKETFVEEVLTVNGDLGLSDIEGPLLFFKNRKTSFVCYSLNSRVNSSLDPKILQFSPLAGIAILSLALNFEPDETFIPGRKPGGLLAVHSPFQMVNPYDFGHSIKPGKMYKVHLKMEEEELLPYPFHSSCINYTEIWLDNGRKGPRSQEMCKQVCLMNSMISSCTCSLKIVDYPMDENMCFTEVSSSKEKQSEMELTSENQRQFTENYSCLTSKDDEIQECLENNCKEDCQKYKFIYTVEERAIEESDLTETSDMEKQISHVQIYTSDPEVVAYKYRPHYQDIEVFSYIGGYIGAWLGISLLAVADFFECSFRIAVFAFRKRKQKDGATSSSAS